jgi:hypothetical protein
MDVHELELTVAKVAGSVITVTDRESCNIASEYLKTIKAQSKRVKDFFADPKAKAAATHKAICAQENQLLAPLEQLEISIKGMIGAFELAEQRRIAAEEERRRKEAEELAALSVEAEASGDTGMAQEALAEAMVNYTPNIQTKTQGVSTRFDWVAIVEDAEKVPRMFLLVNDAALQAFAKQTKGKSQVPGVRFEQKAVVCARA